LAGGTAAPPASFTVPVGTAPTGSGLSKAEAMSNSGSLPDPVRSRRLRLCGRRTRPGAL